MAPGGRGVFLVVGNSSRYRNVADPTQIVSGAFSDFFLSPVPTSSLSSLIDIPIVLAKLAF
jgi:hypothetical protein